MNKILLITTGGTLACTPSENGLVPTLTGRDILTYSAHPELAVKVKDFRLIDSSIMTDDDRRELAEIIWEAKDEYDSFVITHGTDSMAYTAAYLDCALPNFTKSIVITGAQLPLMEEGTDRVGNLNLALSRASDGYKGVCLAINGKLIPAKTATKVDTEGFDAFASVTGEYITGDVPMRRGAMRLTKPSRKTGLIYITPNLRPDTIEMYRGFDRVIALVLGAGGMPKRQEAAFDMLKEKGVQVYIKSQCINGKVEAIYEAHSGVGKFTPINGTSVDRAVYRVMFGLE